VNLTRKQIEDSPPIEAHKPVSLQYEEEYFRYYGWPAYPGLGGMYGGGGMSGIAGFPVVPTMCQMPEEETNQRKRSIMTAILICEARRQLTATTSKPATEKIGHVTDFIMDDENWAICHLVIETGHWFAGKQIAISPEQIDRISSVESKIFVKVTKEAILEAPEYYMPPFGGESSDENASRHAPNGQPKSVSL